MKPAFIHIGKLPGLNEYVKACRSHPLAGNNMAQDAKMEVYADIINSKVGRYGNPVEIRMVWHEPKDHGQRRDFDNITFAQKFILDAMQMAHVTDNDDLEHVRSITHEVIPEEKPPHGVEVYIKEVQRHGW